MARRLLRGLGPAKASLLITTASISSSILLYLVVALALHRIVAFGIILSIAIPAIVAPLLSYSLLGLLIKLDQAEIALARVNQELESRVEQRTIELTRANQELQVEIAERGQAEQRVQASLREKEVLLKEIHHRVKNNLQIISSMLRLQSGHILDPKVLRVFEDSQHRIRSMALIHEKLYQSENLAKVDLAEYIQSLTAYLLRSHATSAQEINLQVQADEVFLGIDAAVPCGLILNELVTNALKHAFPDRRPGEIHVSLDAQSEGKFVMTVRDDGVGLPKDLDLEHTETLGLKLVSALVQQLEGGIELDRTGGTTFQVTLIATT